MILPNITAARRSRRGRLEQRRGDSSVEIRRRCFPDFLNILNKCMETLFLIGGRGFSVSLRT
ncbi:hypothetical protein SAMN05421736_101679 [Evansella caseinilytica]|uniref:Uncharacterized protein n=1 Tax=Evansella caseinilytica TaxID=1503961 RepID=A0A1H3I187_9BACI|nr:hypothetical protein SAMN05421736_101679 [Evansella caseinilytica]